MRKRIARRKRAAESGLKTLADVKDSPEEAQMVGEMKRAFRSHFEPKGFLGPVLKCE